MVERYNHNLWNRAKWQQERDAARVAAGACARVSMAAELDRFHAELERPFGPGSVHAAKRLDDRVQTYLVSVHTKHPAWGKRVATQLGERIRAVVDEMEKIGRCRDEFNKAAALIQSIYEPAEADIEDWLGSGGDTRLGSRHVAILVAGLRDLYLSGQRLAYVTDRFNAGICADARKYWSIMDSGRPPDRSWLEGVNELRVRLRPV